jgi:hypothetical protein
MRLMPRSKNNTQIKNTLKPQDVSIILEKYKVAIDRNVMESDVMWTRYNAMLTINSILIGGLGFIISNETSIFFQIIFSFIGVIISCIWLSMTSRGFQWLVFWIEEARHIEENHLKDYCCEKCDPINEGYRHQKYVQGFKVAHTAKIIIWLFILLYSTVFISSLFGVQLK